MIKKWLMTGLILLTATATFAHEHWLDISNFLPQLEEKVKVIIGSGHSFPVSEIVLGEKLLIDTKIITPSRKGIEYKTSDDKTRRISDEVPLTETGIYLIQFNLKKPQEKEPLYYAKSIVTLGEAPADKEFNPLSYTLGSHIEIIPQQLLTTLKKDDELTLKVLCGDKPLKETLEVAVKLPPEKPDDKPARPNAEGGQAGSPADREKPSGAEKNFTIKSDRDGIARFKIPGAGKYLIALDNKGIGCSLTFYIEDKETKK